MKDQHVVLGTCAGSSPPGAPYRDFAAAIAGPSGLPASPSLALADETRLHRSNLDHAADSAEHCPKEKPRRFVGRRVPRWDAP